VPLQGRGHIETIIEKGVVGKKFWPAFQSFLVKNHGKGELTLAFDLANS